MYTIFDNDNLLGSHIENLYDFLILILSIAENVYVSYNDQYLWIIYAENVYFFPLF